MGSRYWLGAWLCVLVCCDANAQNVPGKPFLIQLVDEQTHRGIPLVLLKSTSNRELYTDSNGLVAIADPTFIGQKVYFTISSDGYEMKADGFGFRGRAFDVRAGGEATVELKRLNLAERLYRLTGEGVYRDTVIAGRKAPVKAPLMNGKVTGQDSVQMLPFNGKLYWFWGDTNRLAYPLGHFGMAGATSELPSNGGLDPSVGVDLTYFTDKTGFSRPTCDIPGEGPKWLDGLMVVKNDSGQERMLARYQRMKSLETVVERGIVQWDEESGYWKIVKRFELDAPLAPIGQPIRITDGAVEYFYFYSNVRVKADYKSILDPGQYEALTCLPEGTRYAKGEAKIDRKEDGSVNWAWKHDTSPVSGVAEHQLVTAGKLMRSECRLLLRDWKTGRSVTPHAGSICWNEYRKKWVQICVEYGGDASFLGEVWYAEAESPTGPWATAQRIVTHHRYSFYNPVQHPVFDQEGGRVIYFEGTYANSFSGNDHPTPMYDYNQVMYRLDLAKVFEGK